MGSVCPSLCSFLPCLACQFSCPALAWSARGLVPATPLLCFLLSFFSFFPQLPAYCRLRASLVARLMIRSVCSSCRARAVGGRVIFVDELVVASSIFRPTFVVRLSVVGVGSLFSSRFPPQVWIRRSLEILPKSNVYRLVIAKRARIHPGCRSISKARSRGLVLVARGAVRLRNVIMNWIGMRSWIFTVFVLIPLFAECSFDLNNYLMLQPRKRNRARIFVVSSAVAEKWAGKKSRP